MEQLDKLYGKFDVSGVKALLLDRVEGLRNREIISNESADALATAVETYISDDVTVSNLTSKFVKITCADLLDSFFLILVEDKRIGHNPKLVGLYSSTLTDKTAMVLRRALGGAEALNLQPKIEVKANNRMEGL